MSKKNKLYHTVYFSTLFLFSLFVGFLIVFDVYLSYTHFLDTKEKISKDIISTKKELLKNKLNFFLHSTNDLTKKQFLEKINTFRFGPNNKNYIFAASYDGISLSYPAKGKNVYNATDLNGKKVVQELIKTAKQGSGYVTYLMPFKKERNVQKISYVVGIDKWNMYVGIGELLKEIEQTIQQQKQHLLEEFYHEIFAIIIISIIFLLLFYILFHRFNKNFLQDIQVFTHSLDEFINDNKPIDEKLIKHDEFQKMSTYVNDLFHKKNVLEKELKEKEMVFYQQAKLASMGEMIENIAHQWRQPLTMITLSSSAAQLKYEQGILDDKFLLESLNHITESAEYLSNTIDDFRTFFIKNKTKDSFVLKESIQKALKLLKTRVKKQHVKIITNFIDISITSYKNELLQVYLVILNNALDALSNTNIDDIKLIFIDIYFEGDQVCIEFKDNAGGVKKKYLEKVFEPYFTTKHQSQGTGIGLYMAKEIVEKHFGGTIELENTTYTYSDRLYKGALVKLTLPLS